MNFRLSFCCKFFLYFGAFMRENLPSILDLSNVTNHSPVKYVYISEGINHSTAKPLDGYDYDRRLWLCERKKKPARKLREKLNCLQESQEEEGQRRTGRMREWSGRATGSEKRRREEEEHGIIPAFAVSRKYIHFRILPFSRNERRFTN